MPTGGRIFAFFCSPRDHRPQNSGCVYTAQSFHTGWDIFPRHGEAWRTANAGHVSLAQRRVMSAIEICRTAELGGHVERCEECAHTRVAYNSCRNRHCPKCQWPRAQAWLAAREGELLPVPYFHFVFRLPAAIRPIAYQNKAL